MIDNRKKIGVDIDGVLAEFPKKFAEVINRLYGCNICEPPTSWDFANWNLTKAQLSGAWAAISQTSNFWETLSLMDDVDLRDLYRLNQTCKIFYPRA